MSQQDNIVDAIKAARAASKAAKRAVTKRDDLLTAARMEGATLRQLAEATDFSPQTVKNLTDRFM